MKAYVYIVTNINNTVLYTGVTSDLTARITKHKEKKYPGSFSAKYNLFKLVYYDSFGEIGEAIKREKLIKGGSRKKKLELINWLNPSIPGQNPINGSS
jgi:putative endonuclease